MLGSTVIKGRSQGCQGSLNIQGEDIKEKISKFSFKIFSQCYIWNEVFLMFFLPLSALFYLEVILKQFFLRPSIYILGYRQYNQRFSNKQESMNSGTINTVEHYKSELKSRY